MKYIKNFELKTPKIIHDLFSQTKFKVGDIVRTKDNLGLFDLELQPGHNYFRIEKIDTIHPGYHFLLQNIINTSDMTFYDQGDNLELVPEYEITAVKYNL